ncbi:maleylpyruvate isomerase family mycothiol-dependent enzyme [Microlunatus aurantiacus]|uniref:Maleylpyruvate isomerase family mycothiol-dependent enzyme n=1 Tax=Microlunatus aurantiacus TaxID=446786 RepID=A0ABP7EEX4_9ACTN
MPRRLDYSRYLTHLAEDSARFAEVLSRTPYETAVPTCPGWDAADLLFHLAEVQAFWARIVARRLTTGDQVDELETVRPGDAELAALFADRTAALQEALRDTPAETPVWTWASEQTAGFCARRQAHEALIHRLDAELTAGERSALDPTLAADGVDEVLGVMYGEPPAWGAFTADHDHVVRFDATDTGDTWSVTVARFVGLEPGGGAAHETDCLDWVADDVPPTASVSATAADLDCWLWRRPPVGELTVSGSEATLDRLAAVMADGVS